MSAENNQANKDKINLNEIEIGKRVRVKKLDSGSLWARKTVAGGIVFYWRFTLAGASDWIYIGIYDARNPPRSIEPIVRSSGETFSIQAASAKADAIARAHKKSVSSGGGGISEIHAQRKAERLEKEAQKIDDKKHTVASLIELYCASLANLKTRRDFEGMFAKHIINAHPKIAHAPAKSVDAETWADALRELASNHPHTARKLRSYIKAAYTMAIKSPYDLNINIKFKAFKIKSNPLNDIPPPKANKADKDALSADELRTYWGLIRDLEGIKGAVLRLHLLTGGLRVLQLLRLKPNDITRDLFTLYDIKGKRDEPSAYSTPITATARKDFDYLLSINPTGFVFSTNGGITNISPETVLHWAQKTVGDSIVNFKIKRIRSGIETLLSSKRVAKDIRGRLQSHGITGVQDVHYDDYDYLREKLNALKLIEKTLNETDTDNNVIKLFG